MSCQPDGWAAAVRPKEDLMRLIISDLKLRQTQKIVGSYRHLHHEHIGGQLWLEVENDTDDGKVSLYLDEHEVYRLLYELQEFGLVSTVLDFKTV